MPSTVTETLRLRVPPATVARLMLMGESFRPEEALALGLVDELVSSDVLLDRACEQAAGMIRPGTAYAQIKADLLAQALDQIAVADDRQLDGMMDTWFNDEAQQQLAAVVRQLDQGESTS
jgi:enoyl-CoA hydratase